MKGKSNKDKEEMKRDKEDERKYVRKTLAKMFRVTKENTKKKINPQGKKERQK